VLKGEFEKERRLIEKTRTRALRSQSFRALTRASQREMLDRLRVVECLHEVKKLCVLNIIAVAGPQNSGKTTLISQLTMDPGAGVTGFDRAGRTASVATYRMPSSSALTLLVDSPGLTSEDEELQRQFWISGNIVGNVYVYIRTWQGVEDGMDLQDVVRILSTSSDPSPHLLLCLNKVVANRRDATGEAVSRSTLLEIVESFKAGVQRSYQKYARKIEDDAGEDWRAWLAKTLKAESRFKVQNLTVKMVELGRPLKDCDEDIREDVFDARRIMQWVEGVISARGSTDRRLHEHALSINYQSWCELTRQYKETERKRQEEALEAAMNAQRD